MLDECLNHHSTPYTVKHLRITGVNGQQARVDLHIPTLHHRCQAAHQILSGCFLYAKACAHICLYLCMTCSDLIWQLFTRALNEDHYYLKALLSGYTF